MIQPLGDFRPNSVVRFKWNTAGANGASITRSTAGTIRIYKDDSTTERTSSNGITDTVNFDGITGVHHCTIDLSDNTDAGFYSAGSDYFVVLVGAVIDGQTVNATLAQFSIGKLPESRLSVRGVVGTGSTTTSIVTSSLTPSVSAADQLLGRIVIFHNNTSTQALRSQATRITASTAAGVLTVDALTHAPASGDTFDII
jgi:hypothetical protein